MLALQIYMWFAPSSMGYRWPAQKRYKMLASEEDGRKENNHTKVHNCRKNYMWWKMEKAGNVRLFPWRCCTRRVLWNLDQVWAAHRSVIHYLLVPGYSAPDTLHSHRTNIHHNHFYTQIDITECS